MTPRAPYPSELTPKALALFQALPRGVRMQRWRIANIAALIGMSPREATAARDALVRHGLVEEFEPRDGSSAIEKWEWRVREGGLDADPS